VTNARPLQEIPQLIIPLIIPHDDIVLLDVEVVDHRDRQLPEPSAVVAVAGVQAGELAEVIRDRRCSVGGGMRVRR